MTEAMEEIRQARPRRFRPYPEYEDSGVLWIGEIPRHWTATRTKFAARLESGHTPSRQKPEYWENCTIPWFGLADVWQIRDGRKDFVVETNEKVSELGLAHSSARLLPKGTVILSRTASVGFSAILGTDMATTQDFVNWVCSPRIRPEYLLCVFRSMGQEFRRLTMGSTHQTIYMPDVNRFETPLPPLEEQDGIVRFIRRETAKIDGLVAKKERLIELLHEKRTALITRAVTQGLDPNVPMKDSGVEWLGKIPAHWEAKRVKWVARMASGHTPDKKVAAYWDNGKIPWVSLNDTRHLKDHDYISETAYCTNELGLQNSSAWLLPSRTVVFSRDATIGRCAITEQPMAVSQHFIAWICGDEMRPEYLLRVFDSMQNELERLTMGATLKTIGMPDVKTLATPVPPVEEQNRIVAHLDQERKRVDALVAKVREAVARLREFRTALISAAVTGKIDVRAEEP